MKGASIWIPVLNFIIFIAESCDDKATESKARQENIISRCSAYLDIIKLGCDGTYKKTGRNYAENHQKRKDMYPYIRENRVDNDWINRTDSSSLGKILFMNGHYNFTRCLFFYMADPSILMMNMILKEKALTAILFLCIE